MTGSVIHSYLQSCVDLPPQSVHTLFSSNRWEAQPAILQDIDNGTCVLLDRYAGSGVAYTFAKGGTTLQWCKLADTGLLKPDLTVYLNLPDGSTFRPGFGDERYEEAIFMGKVHNAFGPLFDSTWVSVDASGDVPTVHQRVVDTLQPLLSTCPGPKTYLWN